MTGGPTSKAQSVLRPSWQAPASVSAFTTTRDGGTSDGHYGLADGSPVGLNLGLRCGDDPLRVHENRRRLRSWLPAEPHWMNQVHGNAVWQPGDPAVDAGRVPIADAAVTDRRAHVLVVLSADCLPVFFCDLDGSAVGIAHAGWRGLAGGVLENTVSALRYLRPSAAGWLAHLGPAIGPASFEVGPDVVAAFCDQDAGSAGAFVPTGRADKCWGNLYALARRRLAAVGIEQVTGGDCCTVIDAGRFYSHRRDRGSGRMASLIWLA